MSEGESFADVITTHQLDDNLDLLHVATREFQGDSKICKGNKPQSSKRAASGSIKHVSVEPLGDFTTQSGTKGRNVSTWEEDSGHNASAALSVSPSSMLNIGESSKKKGLGRKSPGTSTTDMLAKSGQRDISAFIDDSDSSYMMGNNSQSTKQCSSMDLAFHSPRSRYQTKRRSPFKSSLFPMSDEDDTDDDSSNGDSPVAMNLSLTTKSSVRASSNTELLPKFSAQQNQAVNRSRDSAVGSPLDAIMKMTSMINTSKNEPSSSVMNTDAAIATSGFVQPPSAAHFQSRGDISSPGAPRIFGSDSFPAMSYGKIAAAGVLKLPVAAEVSGCLDGSTLTRSTSEFSSNPAVSRTADVPWDSSNQLQSAIQASADEPAKAYSAQERPATSSPIKLRIRRGNKGDNSQLSIVTPKQVKDKSTDAIAAMKSRKAVSHPSPLALSLLGAVPSPSAAPTGTANSKLPAPGRAKTKVCICLFVEIKVDNLQPCYDRDAIPIKTIHR